MDQSTSATDNAAIISAPLQTRFQFVGCVVQRAGGSAANSFYHLCHYFDPEARSRYYRTSTLGHNTIVIDGQSQPATGRAFIVHQEFEPSLSRVVLDMTLAYPGCRRSRREFTLIDGRHVVIVDEILPSRPL